LLVLLGLALAASCSSAAASVTIGQTGSDPFTGCLGVVTYDIAQPTVSAGTSYVAPETGVITSWSHMARDEPNQEVTMKIWRRVSGTTYKAVGHDGPRPLAPGVLNSFEGIHVPVLAGDVLGLNVSAGAYTACFFPASEDSVLISGGNAADGEEATFSAAPGFRANISAVIEPDCDHDGLGDETQDSETSSCHPPTLTSTGLPQSCVVPKLKGKTLKAAKKRARKAHCRIGKVKLLAGVTAKTGKVVKQKPKAGKVKAARTRIAVTLG
jgi:PASTA domain